MLVLRSQYHLSLECYIKRMISKTETAYFTFSQNWPCCNQITVSTAHHAISIGFWFWIGRILNGNQTFVFFPSESFYGNVLYVNLTVMFAMERARMQFITALTWNCSSNWMATTSHGNGISSISIEFHSQESKKKLLIAYSVLRVGRGMQLVRCMMHVVRRGIQCGTGESVVRGLDGIIDNRTAMCNVVIYYANIAL